MIDGRRLPTAVPEVVTTPTGSPDAFACPNAQKPAPRSSIRIVNRTRPAAAASARANSSGALRDPGAATNRVTP
ncbi:hypothetical protein GCM10009702_09170 [Propioniferax innocua]